MAVATRYDDALGVQFAADRHRPRYHFMPPAQWMNDPNGLLHWQGRYHMFYQHNPAEARHADMHWGHAVSVDLVHWEHLPIALAPTPDSPDQDGIYSGCAVDNDGTPTLIYSGVRGTDQLVCLATADPADPDLISWRKDPGNPVIPAPPPGVEWVAYRDPSVWREADGSWAMVHGAGIVGAGGTALLYRSPDLVDWEYVGPILTGDVARRAPLWTGSMWECPQLFPLGDKHVLIIAVWFKDLPRPSTHYPVFMIGTFDGRHFVPERQAILDAGAGYAPQSLRDAQGRRILWNWLRETREIPEQRAAGWSGVMSLPWHLTLRPDGALGIAPVAEVEALRGAHTRLPAITLAESDQRLAVAGDTVELLVEIEPGDAARVGLTVRRAPDDAEVTRIVYEQASGRLAIERDRSSLDATVARTTRTTVVALAPGEPLRLRVFLDRSVIELFANERQALTERIYPTRDDSLGIGVFAEGGTGRVRSLDCWQLGTI